MSFTSRWEDGRHRLYQARVRSLIGNQRWAEALTAVIDLAQWSQGRIFEREAWLELLINATEIVGHLEEPGEYRAFLDHFGVPFLGEGPEPDSDLIAAFSTMATYAEPALMIDIGAWLTDARPDWPLGPYLAGHFQELAAREKGSDQDVAAATRHLRVAEERGRRGGQPMWESHARLRRGALLLTSGVDRRKGRKILGDLDWTRYFAPDQLWMALALTSSPRWIDRLRAMDIILDLHRAISQARPHYRDLRLDDLRRAASTVFKLAGLRLSDSEDNRLEELSETLFVGAELQYWKSYLQARRRLSKISELPVDQADEVMPLLEKLSAVYPDRWQAVDRRFRILRSGWTGKYSSTASVPTPRRRDMRLPITDAIAEVLSLLRNLDDESATPEVRLLESLNRLNDALSTLEPDGDGGAARPVALVWPAVLDASSKLSLELPEAAELKASLRRLAQEHARVAPPPTYGWWILAAHLYDADLDGAADAVAKRALDSQPHPDEPTAAFVISRAFASAVESEDAASAQGWLKAL